MKRLRVGMIGGGEGSFIGAVHRMAMRLDGRFDLVAGALSSDPQRALRSGTALGLAADKCYASWSDMVAQRAGLDAVVIVTPNHLHFEPAQAALAAGLHVMCDKPATTSLASALHLQEVTARSSAVYGLSYTYLGYPMVAAARELVANGALGEVRRVDVRYAQGWLAQPVERQGNAQAAWRTDPERAGAGGASGDIGTHAFALAEYVTGDRVHSVSADLRSAVPGRRLDDDAAALLRFSGGARGTLVATQIAAGLENDLTLEVCGSQASLRWCHQQPSSLELRHARRPMEVLRAGVDNAYLAGGARALCRLPSGHPEGYLEAFANIYGAFAERALGVGDAGGFLPGIAEGVRGMAFVEAMVRSSAEDGRWTALTHCTDDGKAA